MKMSYYDWRSVNINRVFDIFIHVHNGFPITRRVYGGCIHDFLMAVTVGEKVLENHIENMCILLYYNMCACRTRRVRSF